MPMKISLSEALEIIEKKTVDLIYNTKLKNDDQKAAQDINTASILLQWARFTIPLVKELERIAPQFDYAGIKANGYRSLLAIQTYTIEPIFRRITAEQLHAISDEELRSFAQSCEMVLLGLLIHEYILNNESHGRTVDELSKHKEPVMQHRRLVPPASVLKHSCYQQIATKCNAEIDSRHFAHARITFGYSVPLRSLIRLVNSATVAIHEAEADSLAFQQSVTAQNNTVKSQDPALETGLATSAIRVADSLHKPIVAIKAVLRALTLSLPLRPIESQRIERSASVAQHCSSRFVQRCWNLSEVGFVHFGEMLVAPSIRHVELVTLQFSDFAVPLRIICPIQRNRAKSPLCGRVLLHAHGGGFIAHTSKSHESYLRRVANELQVPIVSVDYSTAPQSCFPRPVEECYAVYKWLLRTQSKGVLSESRECDAAAKARNAVLQRLLACSTCESVYFFGDSAGGNLLMSVMQRAVLDGLPVPRGFVGVYTPMLLQFAPSPSRMMTLIDPLVPSRTFAACLLAYFGHELGPTLETLEVNCSRLYHPHSAATNGHAGAVTSAAGVSVDVQLCEDCAKLRVAGRLLSDYLLDLNRLRVQLFRGLPPAGCSWTQHVRTSCALVKLQLFTMGSNFASSKSVMIDDGENTAEEELPTSAPLYWSDSTLKQLPRIALITPSVLDATIDDNIDFAKRLAALGVPVTYDAIEKVPHGFLNFSGICPNAANGLNVCISRLRDMFNAESD